MTSRRFTLFLAFVLCGVPGRTCDANAHPDLSKTAGYRHESIPVAVEKLRGIAQVQSLRTKAGEDAEAFSPERLRGYRAVIFVNTTGDILDPEQRQALEGFIRAGGGFMGVHAAADTQYDRPCYGELVGAWFSAIHPPRGCVRRGWHRWGAANGVSPTRSTTTGAIRVDGSR